MKSVVLLIFTATLVGCGKMASPVVPSSPEPAGNVAIHRLQLDGVESHRTSGYYVVTFTYSVTAKECVIFAFQGTMATVNPVGGGSLPVTPNREVRRETMIIQSGPGQHLLELRCADQLDAITGAVKGVLFQIM